MGLQENIKELEQALKSFEGLQKSQEETYSEAMDEAKGMEDCDEKVWLINSLLTAKDGTLSAAEFTKQMKDRGYGS